MLDVSAEDTDMGQLGCAQGIRLNVYVFMGVIFGSRGAGSIKYAGCRAMRFGFWLRDGAMSKLSSLNGSEVLHLAWSSDVCTSTIRIEIVSGAVSIRFSVQLPTVESVLHRTIIPSNSSSILVHCDR